MTSSCERRGHNNSHGSAAYLCDTYTWRVDMHVVQIMDQQHKNTYLFTEVVCTSLPLQSLCQYIIRAINVGRKTKLIMSSVSSTLALLRCRSGVNLLRPDGTKWHYRTESKLVQVIASPKPMLTFLTFKCVQACFNEIASNIQNVSFKKHLKTPSVCNYPKDQDFYMMIWICGHRMFHSMCVVRHIVLVECSWGGRYSFG